MQKAPLTFRPYYKHAVWGGNAIARYKGEDLPGSDIGESWELSALPGCESVVAEGPYAGKSLSELTSEFGVELLGEEVAGRYDGRFPLLVKFIDAKENLSVQVHPDDKLARSRHNCPGKTEMWYVISAAEGSRIYSGLKRTLSIEEYVSHVEQGSFFELVASHESRPGDIYYLPSGQVHAIGAGNLLAEIQQPSDITYRIFDYKRKDAEGRERTLHTEMAIDAIDLTGGKDFRLPRPSDSHADVELLSCDYFTVRRLKGSSRENETANSVNLALTGRSFLVVMCIEGSLTAACEEGSVRLTEGHTALIPASCSTLTLTGDATTLLVYLDPE